MNLDFLLPLKEIRPNLVRHLARERGLTLHSATMCETVLGDLDIVKNSLLEKSCTSILGPFMILVINSKYSLFSIMEITSSERCFDWKILYSISDFGNTKAPNSSVAYTEDPPIADFFKVSRNIPAIS